MRSTPRKSAKAAAKAKPLATDMKLRPSQARSQETIEQIVRVTGLLLEEMGFEQLSTNLVCRRANLTPPALYRYFPNKYALLRELGERLMRAQDDALLAWIDRGGLDTSSTQEAVAQNVLLMNEIIEITRAFPGQIAILRALRAVPGLREVRLASRDMVAARLAEAIAPSLPNVPFETLCIATRMTTEMGTTAAEMVLEEPQLDREIIVQQVTRATVAYYDALRATTTPTKTKTKAKS